MNDKGIADSMAILETWLKESNLQLNDINADGLAQRQKVAVSLLQVCQEHALSIALLVKENLVGSALALLRVQFESLLRGWWLAKCANDEWFQQEIVEKKDFPSAMKKTMLSGIEKIYPEDVFKQFAAHAAGTKSLYDDFTHGGYAQFARRFDERGNVGYGSRNIECLAAIKSTMYYDSLAKAVTLEVMGRADIAEHLTKLSIDLYGKFPKLNAGGVAMTSD